MAAAGIHGVRLNFETASERNPDNARRTLAATAEQIRDRGWHIQLNAALPLVVALKDELAAPRGSDASAMVAAGAADLAVMPVSEILVAPGVEFAGAIPSEIQMIQVFAAAIVAGSQAIEASRRLIEFLASPRASETISRSGMEPLATSR